ncbi:hypothetical protein JCM8097_007879 [Rhodosporidiobolus ruineniae]
MDPLVSTRVSLALSHAAPSGESSAVIVLQGRSGFFLDLRIKHAGSAVPGRLGPLEFRGVDQRELEVDWATAGWKEFLPPLKGEDRPRARFTPIIDSRSPSFGRSSASSSTPPPADSSPDEGSFETLPNGDVLEKGEMLNPDSGRVEPYEEVWRRLPLTWDGSEAKITILERDDEDGRAFLGRVGDWEVGMVDGKSGFGVVWRERRRGEWEDVHRNEAGVGLPSLEKELLTAEKGGLVDLGGRTWKVIEKS